MIIRNFLTLDCAFIYFFNTMILSHISYYMVPSSSVISQSHRVSS